MMYVLFSYDEEDEQKAGLAKVLRTGLLDYGFETVAHEDPIRLLEHFDIEIVDESELAHEFQKQLKFINTRADNRRQQNIGSNNQTNEMLIDVTEALQILALPLILGT